MLRFLQKRKFRLVTRWKLALKDNVGSLPPLGNSFPYALIFRAFDELIRGLKQEPADESLAAGTTFLHGLSPTQTPSPDQYMELFLTGRDVFAEFIHQDPTFSAIFDEASRNELYAACETVLKRMIEREMRELSRHQSGIPTHRHV